MFSTFKKLFGKRGADKSADSGEDFSSGQMTAPPPAPVPATSPRRRVDVPTRAAVRDDVQPAPVVGNNSTISLPLSSIIGRLPPELMERIRQMDVGEAEVFLPLQRVLPQLAHGSVRISFGELRQASPPGTFSPENDRDRVPIDLPLNEILARVSPGLLSRRTVQRHVDVPAEVTGPFGGQNIVTISSASTKPSAPVRQMPATEDAIFRRANVPAAPPSAPNYSSPNVPNYPPVTPSKAMPLPASQGFTRVNSPPPAQAKPSYAPDEALFKRATPPPQQSPVPQGEPIFRRNNTPVPAPAPPPEPLPEEPIFRRMNNVPPSAPNPQPVSPIVPGCEQPPQPIPFNPTGFAPVPAAPRRPPVSPLSPPQPVPLPSPHAEPEVIRFSPSFPPPSTPTPPTPQAAPRETIFLTMSLSELWETWPDPVRQEIAALGLAGASVALPQGLIEAAIRQGKVVFPWKLVRSWIKPPLPPNYASPQDVTVLELPLKTITPAFLTSLRSVRPQRKVSVASDIPNLFSGAAGPETAAAPTAAAAPVAPPAPAPPPTPVAPTASQNTDTNYYVLKENGQPPPEEAPPVVKKGPSPGTSFLQRYATPNEIVGKAASLNGVGGAIIALPDGLLVASKIPSDMNADTLAAFLPQIFGRVSQSTRELRMGDLNNLNFTVGLIPWKIFRVGAIYFAAFGIAGQALPTAQLAGIAAELDRKAK
jgi:hypothetical protein